MKAETRARPSLEALEQRWCPSVTARVDHGNLLVSGAATHAGDTISITQTGANSFSVKDGGTVVGTGDFTGITKDVVVNLGAADDKLALDLGGNATPRNVFLNLGRGDNQLSVVGGSNAANGVGTVSGFFTVLGGRGVDAVTLGDGTNSLQFNKEVSVGLDGSATDSLSVMNKVTAKRDLEAFFVNNVTLAAGSVVQKNVAIIGGTAGNTVALGGEVDGNVSFSGSGNADSLTLTGTVGKSVFASTFGGIDTVAIGGTVTGHLYLDTGAGNDAITVSGTIGKTTAISAGAGDDTLTITADARFQGNAFIGMGGGNDTVTLNDAATITTMLADQRRPGDERVQRHADADGADPERLLARRRGGLLFRREAEHAQLGTATAGPGRGGSRCLLIG